MLLHEIQVGRLSRVSFRRWPPHPQKNVQANTLDGANIICPNLSGYFGHPQRGYESSQHDRSEATEEVIASKALILRIVLSVILNAAGRPNGRHTDFNPPL